MQPEPWKKRTVPIFVWCSWLIRTWAAITAVRPVTVTVATSPTPNRFREQTLRRVVFWGILGTMLASAPAVMADPDTKDTHVSFKRIQGTVSAVSSQGIAVELARTEMASEEMYLPFEKALKLQGVGSAKDLQAGDEVLVEYRETLTKDDKGQYSKASRAAVRVALLKRALPAPAEPQTAEETEEETR